jgi:hypothetical protein
MSVDRKPAWLEYARKLHEAGLNLMNEADKMTVGSDVRDPKLLAMALLYRLISARPTLTRMPKSAACSNRLEKWRNEAA